MGPETIGFIQNMYVKGKLKGANAFSAKLEEKALY